MCRKLKYCYLSKTGLVTLLTVSMTKRGEIFFHLFYVGDGL